MGKVSTSSQKIDQSETSVLTRHTTTERIIIYDASIGFHFVFTI